MSSETPSCTPQPHLIETNYLFHFCIQEFEILYLQDYFFIVEEN